MARPREFDPDVALDAVMRLFWLQGFQGTSIDDLVRVTGMNRYSLYGVWGDKHALYLAAVRRYAESIGAEWMARLDASEDPLAGIREMFVAMSAAIAEDTSRHGCLALNTALELGRHDDVARGLVREILDAMQAAFERALVRARDLGQLAPGADPAVHARHLAVSFQAVLLQARNGAPRETVDAFVTVALSTLPEVSRCDVV
ncbi:MAG: TetR/AcrR family transcriptional regulator [Myxococcota bacterium]